MSLSMVLIRFGLLRVFWRRKLAKLPIIIMIT
jgi:hypothetical protein